MNRNFGLGATSRLHQTVTFALPPKPVRSTGMACERRTELARRRRSGIVVAMRPALPITQDLVLVGGGHAHVHVLKRFGMRPAPGVRVTLITRDLETPYSGMLPGYVAGLYDFAECHIDLVRLARFAGARLIHDEAVGLDRAARRVLCRDHPPFRYDIVSLDIGSTPRSDDVPGAAEHTVAVKPIDRFGRRWEALLARAAARPRIAAGGRRRGRRRRRVDARGAAPAGGAARGRARSNLGHARGLVAVA